MWDLIARAVQSVKNGDAKRIDGDGWKVYATPGVIRVDIENKEGH